MIVLSHPTGNANSRAAALALARHSQLHAFHTCIATFPHDCLDRLAALPGMGELRRRTFDPSLRSLTRAWPWREAGRLLASRAGASSLVAHERGPFSVDAVYASLDRRVASTLRQRGGPRAVYAYEDGALASFQAARARGIACLYDLPIGYWRTARRLLAVELERWPQWASTLTGMADSEQKLQRKDEELRLADRIFVASSFTRRSLQDFPGELAPVDVIPYGFPPAAQPKPFARRAGDPLKLLFVGGLSQRKGIADLFAVLDEVGDAARLTVVGGRAGPPNSALDAALSKHRWIPSLPHVQVLELMREHDVLVFPSLFEGFGLVITEAMSQGTPVVTTDRTAGADLIEHGKNGWLFEAGSTRRLGAVIEDLLNRPDQIEAASHAALETARRRTWADYGSDLAAAAAGVVDR